MTQILDILDRPIAFQRSFVALGAGITGALFLSQAVYWSRRTGSDGWFWKTAEEWEAETGLTRTEQETARRRLRELGVLVEQKRGIPCKTWFKVEADPLQTRLQESCRLDCRNPADKAAGILQPNTETTSETTSETTKHITKPKEKRFNSHEALQQCGVSEQVILDWLTLRKAKKAAVTETVIAGIQREANKAGVAMESALRVCCERGWQGFKAEWYLNNINANAGRNQRTEPNRHERLNEHVAILTGRHRRQQERDDQRTIDGTADRID